MRDRKDWIRQPMVDEKADAIVAAGKHGVTEVTAYQVAKALGCSPNSALHEKVRDWRRRRLDQAVASATNVTPKGEEELRDALDRMTAAVKAVFPGISERLRGDDERSLMPRVIDAERRRDVKLRLWMILRRLQRQAWNVLCPMLAGPEKKGTNHHPRRAAGDAAGVGGGD